MTSLFARTPFGGWFKVISPEVVSFNISTALRIKVRTELPDLAF